MHYETQIPFKNKQQTLRLGHLGTDLKGYLSKNAENDNNINFCISCLFAHF